MLGGVEYPTIGTETVKLEGMRRAEAKREKLRKENEVAIEHRMKVLEEAEEEDISEDELRKAHASIRNHFMTRFSQVRRGFRMLDEDSSGKLMMLPSDVALLWDKTFRAYVILYSKDEEQFFKDFSRAFGKLLALGTKQNGGGGGGGPLDGLRKLFGL